MNLLNQKLTNKLSGVERKQFIAKRRIIKQLYRNGEMSAAELSAKLQLSTPTSVSYISKLMQDGYIEERGLGNSIGGRRPMRYGLKPNSFYVLGVDVGMKTIKISLFSNDLDCYHKRDESPFNLQSNKYGINFIENSIKSFLLETDINKLQIIGVGLIMPGLINSSKGINYTFLTEETENISKELSKRLSLPVFLENDAKARALAEQRHGTAKSLRNVLTIYVGHGLGMGMILNGALHLGKSGFAGEFSHVHIENNKLLCKCGKTGCLETIASGNALVRMAKGEIEKGVNTILAEDPKYAELSPELIVEAALLNDKLSIELIDRIGLNIGKGVSYLVQILNPEKIIIEGRMTKAGSMLINPIAKALSEYCILNLTNDVEIEMTKLGSDVGLLGAATLVMEKVLSE